LKLKNEKSKSGLFQLIIDRIILDKPIFPSHRLCPYKQN
jgi:hypothetical protein